MEYIKVTIFSYLSIKNMWVLIMFFVEMKKNINTLWLKLLASCFVVVVCFSVRDITLDKRTIEINILHHENVPI